MRRKRQKRSPSARRSRGTCRPNVQRPKQRLRTRNRPYLRICGGPILLGKSHFYVKRDSVRLDATNLLRASVRANFFGGRKECPIRNFLKRSTPRLRRKI